MKKIILRETVPGLGALGEVKEVADGYARNHLIPKKLAYPASPAAEKRVNEEQKLKIVRLEKERHKLLELAAKLKEVSLTVPATVGKEENLYGSVNARDIVASLARDYQVELDEKIIRLEEPIRKLGVYRVKAVLGHDVESILTVWVVKNDGEEQ